MAALVPVPVVPQITPQDKYVVHSTLLNICDMKKDQEPSYSSDVARSITNNSWATEAAALATGWNPPAVGGAGVAARNFYTSPPSKEDMVKIILNNHIFNGAPDPSPNNLYTTLQNTIPGTTGSVQVAWSDQEYTYKCFDIDIEGDGKLETFKQSTIGEIQTFLTADKGILRITDTTRNGSLILAAIPNDILIHGHTPPVEFDACSKLTLESGSGLGAKYPLLNNPGEQNLRLRYMKRFFWEAPPEAGTSIKIKYNNIDDEDTADTIANAPSKHMLIKREINLEYKGIKDKDKKTLNVEMTYINATGKPVRIDEKTNTAGALKKMDVIQNLKNVFGVKSGKNAAEMVHISKLNGDVGQVLETWRQFSLTNDVVIAAGVPNTVNSKDYYMAFESYDCNAVMKAFLEGVDFIFFHTWPTAEAMDKAKNLIIFKKNEFNDPKTIYNALYKEYNDLHKTVSEEIGIYNQKKEKINNQIDKFQAIVQGRPLAAISSDSPNDVINREYINTLKFFIQAAVLETYIPAEKIPAKDIDPLKGPIAEVDVVSDQAIRTLKTEIQEINRIRSSLKIPASYTNFTIVAVFAGIEVLAPVDIEKQVFFEKTVAGLTKAKVQNIFEDININEAIRAPRAVGVFSSSSSKLGIQCIQFILNNLKKFGLKKEFLKHLRYICKKNDQLQASTNYDNIIRLLSLTTLDQEIQSETMNMDGGRAAPPQQSILFNTRAIPMKSYFGKDNIYINMKQNKLKNSAVNVNTRKKSLNAQIIKINDIIESEVKEVEEYLAFSDIFLNEIKGALFVSDKIAEAGSNEEIREIIETYISKMEGGGKKGQKFTQKNLKKQWEKAMREKGIRKPMKDRFKGPEWEAMKKERERQQLAELSRKKRQQILEERRQHQALERRQHQALESAINRIKEEEKELADVLAKDLEDVAIPNTVHIIKDPQLDILGGPKDDLNVDDFSSSFCMLEYDVELLEKIKKDLKSKNDRLEKIKSAYESQPNYMKIQGTVDYIRNTISEVKKRLTFIDLMIKNENEEELCKSFEKEEEKYHKAPEVVVAGVMGGSLKRAKRYRKTRKIRRSKE